MIELCEPYKSIKRLMDVAPEMSAKLIIDQHFLQNNVLKFNNAEVIMPYLNEICEVAMQLDHNIEIICFIRHFLKKMKLPIVQAENWSALAKLHHKAMMGNIPTNIEEIENEFRNIKTTGDAVAFKLRWIL